jgi:DNA-binding MarR family transcriptional regulator
MAQNGSNLAVEKKPQEETTQIREDLLQQILEQIASVIKQVHREVMPRDFFLSPPQAKLLFLIDKHKETGVSVKELARMADITPGAITQFVDALIKKDMVRREADAKDRRVVRLKLTPAAKGQIDKFKKDFFAYAARKFDVLSTDELKVLGELLAKVSSKTPVIDKQAPRGCGTC